MLTARAYWSVRWEATPMARGASTFRGRQGSDFAWLLRIRVSSVRDRTPSLR